MTRYTVKNLKDVDDLAAARPEDVEARIARSHLDSEHLGVSYFRYGAGFHSTLGHSHGEQEEAYVVIKNGELVLIGAHITPLTTASTHVNADPTRTRKLLMHREEINRLVGKVERAGYTLAPLDLHYRNGRVKIEVGLAKGKKQHDKRDTIKDREWAREQQRLLRNRPGSARM